MLSDSLRIFGLNEMSNLERFVRDKGWRRISWTTLFPIWDSKLIALKSVSVENIKDWDVQLEHMYN